jgi:protocatechuate 3,4-dioxygenase beta subunit
MSLSHPLNRRQLLAAALGGSAGAVLLGGPRLLGASPVADALAATACTLTPEQEEGPFYVDLDKIRSNIVGGREGVRLALAITIIDSTTCQPVKGAAVDIWQADAVGKYSSEASQSTTGQTWLRGVQLTDARGLARFTTIWPGFYAGRCPHIHAKVHTGGHVSHNGQIFFPEALSTKVYKTSPYTKDPNTRTARATDHVYTRQGGRSSVITMTDATLAKGLAGRITLAVDTAKSY